MVGVDVFVHSADCTPELLADRLTTLATAALKLQMITNRGVKVWPHGFPETFCTDHWRCRFVASSQDSVVTHQDIIALLCNITQGDIDVIKTENLCMFDGEQGFALGQGQ
jgi:isocitrate dehydrogenase